ncbi:hypothetical protein B0H14DRAFT_2831385, partial [Mycena olivaceomarginata]
MLVAGRLVVIFVFRQHSSCHRGGLVRVSAPLAPALIRWRCQRDALHPFPALRITCPSAYRSRWCGCRHAEPVLVYFGLVSLRCLRQGER